jgi:hypothetical protein
MNIHGTPGPTGKSICVSECCTDGGPTGAPFADFQEICHGCLRHSQQSSNSAAEIAASAFRTRQSWRLSHHFS